MIYERFAKTTVGYTGGTPKNPTYQQVCTGNTGHVEAVEIVFNSNIILYEELLQRDTTRNILTKME